MNFYGLILVRNLALEVELKPGQSKLERVQDDERRRKNSKKGVTSSIFE